MLPELAQRVAESAIGAIIALLALRLLLRWRRGGYHLHAHEHGAGRHTHFHAHGATANHEHGHVAPRTPMQAFLIGVTHGIGGSAAVALLLLASIPGQGWAAAALLIFAFGTAVSMSVLSGAWGWVLGTNAVRRHVRAAVLPLGLLALLFGLLYAAAAWMPSIPVL